MRILIFLVTLLLPTIAYAEVSDKIASIPDLLLQGILLSTLFFFAARYRWWLGLILFPISALLFSGTYDLWQDPYMGRAVLEEQGIKYFVVMVLTDFLVLCALLFGVFFSLKHRAPNKALKPTP